MFGRCIRHANTALCALGGRAFYLMYRFHVTGEWFDFTKNDAWFDTKIMIDPRSQDYTNAMTDQTYRKAIGNVCKELGIETVHYTHFGRAVAPTELEQCEIPKQEIDDLGNWNVDVRQAVYSSKMPLRAMRGAAGYSASQGSHWSARQSFPTPEGLERQIFPQIEASLAKIDAASAADGNQRPTARFFLRYLKNLRKVILQDAAVLINKERRHPLFQMAVFQCPEFKAFQGALVSHLENVENPNHASIEMVLPGVKEWMCSINGGILSMHGAQEQNTASLVQMQNQIWEC